MIGKKEKKNDEREKKQKRVINQRNMGKQLICSQEEV